VLSTEAATPFAGAIVAALRARAPPATQVERIVRMLDKHPRCSVRAATVLLRHATDTARTRATTIAAARTALDASCWQLQAAGLRVLKGLGIHPEAGSGVASFLRDAAGEPARVRAREGENESK
jgi:hypothetical protein